MTTNFRILDINIIQFLSDFVIFVNRPMNIIKLRVFRIYIAGRHESCGVD